MLGMASRAWPKNSKQTVRMNLGMRCKTQVALVIKPSQPSFCTPGNPDKNLSVTSFPKPSLRKRLPSTSNNSVLRTRWPGSLVPSDQVNWKRTIATSWILPMLWSRRSTSNQLPSGSTMRQLARLSKAVPQRTAFLPPAFIAILPPIQLASAEVGSTANTSPACSAASDTRRVTTPAPVKMVDTSRSRPGSFLALTLPISCNFSVLITADIA